VTKFLKSLFSAETPAANVGAALTQASLGDNSPVISGVRGNVAVTYNISQVPEPVVSYFLEQVRKHKISLGEKSKQLEDFARKYKELEKRLAEEAPENTLVMESRELLKQGKIEEAGGPLDELIAQSGRNLASHHFSRGQLYELQLFPSQAMPHYQRAVLLDPENIKYRFAYAQLLHEQNEFDQAESLYLLVLIRYRALAARDSAYLPDVAMTLNSLGGLYSDTRQLEEAGQAHEEALRKYRKLAETNPAEYLPDVAMTLNVLGSVYQDAQRLDEARQAYKEAAQTCQKLAETNPAEYLPTVAMTLNSLGNLYSDTQRLEEAGQAYEGALATQRELVETNPAYLEAVAMTLNNLGNVYRVTQQVKEAGKAYEEALRTYRKLAETNPAAFLPFVSKTLSNVGILYHNTRRLAEAEQAHEEALRIMRKAAEKNPAAYLPDVALMLRNLGVFYSDTQWLEEARHNLGVLSERKARHVFDSFAQRLKKASQALGEAMETYLKLRETNPAEYLPAVAMTLNDLGNLFLLMQAPEDAREVCEQALEIHRYLAEANPAAHQRYVALTLNNLGYLYRVTQRLEEAEQAYEEALQMDRNLAQANPVAFLPGLIKSLNGMKLLLEQTGRAPEAKKLDQELDRANRELEAVKRRYPSQASAAGK